MRAVASGYVGMGTGLRDYQTVEAIVLIDHRCVCVLGSTTEKKEGTFPKFMT